MVGCLKIFTLIMKIYYEIGNLDRRRLLSFHACDFFSTGLRILLSHYARVVMMVLLCVLLCNWVQNLPLLCVFFLFLFASNEAQTEGDDPCNSTISFLHHNWYSVMMAPSGELNEGYVLLFVFLWYNKNIWCETSIQWNYVYA